MEIEERQEELNTLHAELFSAKPEPKNNGNGHHPAASLADTEIIAKAKAAKNGPEFERLMAGDITGYGSHSEADMALCSLLAFWTGNDATKIDQLFRQSGLYREKWERADYREKTISKACGNGNTSIISSCGLAQSVKTKTAQTVERVRNESVRKWGEDARTFDAFGRENKNEWLDKREVAEQVGINYKSRNFRKLVQERRIKGDLRIHGQRPNLIMFINREWVEVDLEAPMQDCWTDIPLPLDLEDHIKIPMGSIGGVAGYVNSGKTAFLMECAELACKSSDMPVFYWFNEMSENKAKERVLDDYSYLVEAKRSGQFHLVEQKDFEIPDVIQPDAVNIVDYLRRTEEVFRHAGDIDALRKNLGNGVLWFGLQKTANSSSGYGGIPTRWLSNIYITLDLVQELEKGMKGRATIRKAKDYLNCNPNGKACLYHTSGKHGTLCKDTNWERRPFTEVQDE